MSAPAGLVYRNYFIGGVGQCSGPQLNLLSDVELLLDNVTNEYWDIQNGYLLPKAGKMSSLRSVLESDVAHKSNLPEEIVKAMKVGIHWDVDVYSCPMHRETSEAYNARRRNQVCQVYCSACPVSYVRGTSTEDWAPFARRNLEGMYAATFAAAAVISRQYRVAARRAEEAGEVEAANALKAVRVKLYLTQVGGGVFGNPTDWISEAVKKASEMFKDEEFDAVMVHYSPPSEDCEFVKLEQQHKKETKLK